MLIYVIKARTITQHGPLPWKMEFNNIQIFGFRYVNYIVFYFIRTISITLMERMIQNTTANTFLLMETFLMQKGMKWTDI
jgi:hypothetical protein